MSSTIKTWKVRNYYRKAYTDAFGDYFAGETITIAGPTLKEAIDGYKRELAWSDRTPNSAEGNMENFSVQKISYSPSILGGKGGVIAEIAYWDIKNKRWGLATAWIYADESDLQE